ncbi:hypothetical protein IPG36_04460 [bacterium]|nr:MAG: hypothetical protein IPG36_04460 [bacterium]
MTLLRYNDLKLGEHHGDSNRTNNSIPKPLRQKYLQHEAVEQNKSISELINDQLAELLEDAEDATIINERKNEPLLAWDKVKAALVRDGLL